jgi:3-oxoadipate enol-lactonase
MSEFILERNGCPIHYWLEGDPSLPLVVFTHGAGADHGMFDKQILALQGRYRTLTWDVRGHGRSRPMGVFTFQATLEDLIAILDVISQPEAVFVGQSMGGNISQELVRHHPERVKALVLVDCVCNSAPLGWLEQFALKITPAMLALYPYNALISQSAKASALRPDVQQYLDRTMRVMTKFEIETVLLETTNILRNDPDYRIAKPFLLLRGDHDNAGAIAKQAKTWAAREPNCQDYTIIPKAGHCSNQDNPDFFNRVLLEFFGRVVA